MYSRALKKINNITGGNSKIKKSDDDVLHFDSNIYDITENFYKTYAEISGNNDKSTSKSTSQSKNLLSGGTIENIEQLYEELKIENQKLSERLNIVEELLKNIQNTVQEIKINSNSKNDLDKSDESDESNNSDDLDKSSENSSDSSDESDDSDNLDSEEDLKNIINIQGGADLETIMTRLGQDYKSSFKNKTVLNGGDYNSNAETSKYFPY